MTRSIRPGLVSITFRKLTPERIIELAAGAGLSGIEWGGDVHVPHGDIAAAKRVRRLTADAGLQVSAYGSYYRVDPAMSQPFTPVLEAALALGSPTIRVWPGKAGSADMSFEDRRRVVADLRDVADRAAAHGVMIDLEYHRNTLADTFESTQRLLDEIDRSNVRSHWQPRHGESTERGVSDLLALRPRLGNLHVFHWWPTADTRRPLGEGVDRWRSFLAAADDGRPRFASLEFIKGDSEEQFAHDARTLLALLAGETA